MITIKLKYVCTYWTKKSEKLVYSWDELFFFKFHLLYIYNKNEKEKNPYKIRTFNTFIFERLYDFITYHWAYL